MATVEFQNVEKVFGGGKRAVSDFSLSVEDGEFLVLLGPSGCGKSTLLRLLAGLETPTNGTIRIGGETVHDRTPQQRNVAMVFQNYALYPHMTVRRNLEFPLRMRKMGKDEIHRQVEETARILGLMELLDRKPRQLSGGQAQRVAMGRAIVRQPAVFLMDEPLSNLDAKLRTEIRGEIAALQERIGTTTIYVTHDQVEAMTLGQRVAVLSDGVLQQLDTPQALYDHPANVFVAGFLGSPAMNIFEAQKELPFKLAEPLPESVRWLGLRPEAFAWPEQQPDWSQVEVRVEAVEVLGHELICYFEPFVPLMNSTEQDRMAARLPVRRGIDPGDVVKLAVDVRQLLAFDADGRAVTVEAST